MRLALGIGMTNTQVHHQSAPSSMSASSLPPAARAHRLQAGVMSAAVVALAALFIAVFGALGSFVMLVSLPAPILLLWLASDVTRADEDRS